MAKSYSILQKIYEKKVYVLSSLQVLRIVLNNYNYTLPRPENRYAKCNGGKDFSKLDSIRSTTSIIDRLRKCQIIKK